MKTEPIPAEWIPYASHAVPYWWGMDTLEHHWERTKSYADHEPSSKAFQEFMFWRRMSVVWTCSTIEAFVNEEGFSWLGGKFFKENLERLSVMKKLHMLYAMKYQRRLSNDNEGLYHIRRLFKLRNSIVHPQAEKFEQPSGDDEDSPGDLRTMEYAHLRKVFWTVTGFFTPDGVGQDEDDMTNKHMESDAGTESISQSEDATPE